MKNNFRHARRLAEGNGAAGLRSIDWFKALALIVAALTTIAIITL